MTSMKILIILVFLISTWIFSPAANAAICRQDHDHDICLLRIKRSAKYYWEYRAAVRIDGETRPVEKYNCRRQVRVKSDNSVVPFEEDGVGKLICRLVKR
jgi:hypothetical protein